MSAGQRRVVVATHGHCFDGLCSAALFTKLHAHVVGKDAEYIYLSSGYGPGENGVNPALLDGDDNAILDFRYSNAPALNWYFDHHVSAFPSDADRASYATRAASSPPRFFHDGTYSSCTKLIADVSRARFDFAFDGLDELIKWADIIDAARFPNAEMAVARTEPALQLMTVVEHHADAPFLTKMVPRLLTQTLEEVALAPDIQAAYAPLRDLNGAFVDLVKTHATERGPVVLVDLLDQKLEVATKFVTYALYPKSAYSVLVTRSKSKAKISVGYNPWSNVARTHDIASICERYGGGGHPVVGAVSLKPDDVDAIRKVALEITTELGG
jgi:hypothetical protein